MNIDNARSYATEDTLNAALIARELNDLRHLVVCNRAGRFTAVFPLSSCEASNVNAGTIAHTGFMVIS